MSRSSSRSKGARSTGGTRKLAPAPDPERWAPLPPNPEHIALVKGVLAKRHRLSAYEVQSFTGFLADAVKRPLSPGVLAWLDRVALRVRAEPVEAEPTPAISFGPLPLKPPGRAA